MKKILGCVIDQAADSPVDRCFRSLPIDQKGNSCSESNTDDQGTFTLSDDFESNIMILVYAPGYKKLLIDRK